MLKEQGSSFSDLLESVRQAVATDCLRNSDISIIQLSDYLGYADNTAFTRALSVGLAVRPEPGEKVLIAAAQAFPLGIMIMYTAPPQRMSAEKAHL